MEILRLRHARPSDLPGIAALERNFPTDRFSNRALRYLLQAPNAPAWVVERDGAIVGALVMLVRRNSRIARIYSISVSRETRQRGIGAALVREAEREALRRGRWLMSLEVKVRNVPARRLYARLGYAVVDRMPRYYGDGAAALRLRKNLVVSHARRGGLAPGTPHRRPFPTVVEGPLRTDRLAATSGYRS